MVRLFPILVLLMTGQSLIAQEKLEVERGIREDEVPSNAHNWVASQTAPEVRVNWFLEETTNKRSYEAKFKRNGDWYSIEFDEDGTFEDVEIITDWGELAPEVQTRLKSYFDSTFTKYKVRKIQRQWSGEESAVVTALSENNDQAEGLIVRYEIEYFAKINGKKAIWEGLFNRQGAFIKKRRVILRPTDNLNY